MKTPITCWNCDTEYDYQQHEVCPMCDAHFLDVPDHTTLEPSPGTRVSVKIDYSRQRLKVLPALLIVILLMIGGCSPYIREQVRQSKIKADALLWRMIGWYQQSLNYPKERKAALAFFRALDALSKP